MTVFVGQSRTIGKILSDIRRLHSTGTTNVLITGESGTGKELVARAVHFGGPRAKHPFIPVNCSAVPRELAESEFFGHLRGAFTGAHRDRKGYFELADGGTLFLDEIGDMPLELQAKLLRVLEDGRFTPVGGAVPKQIDVRVIAATNADFHAKIAEGAFREDLYFRLAAFPVEVPPLRERPEDIPLLVNHFLSMFAEEMRMLHIPTVGPEALEALVRYPFPGNIRELKNIIENALIRCGGGVITPGHLHLNPPSNRRTPLHIPVTENEVETAAQSLGVAPDQIHDALRDDLNTTPDVVSIPPRPQMEEDLILAYIKQNGSISNAECRDFLGADFDHASYLLRKMHRTGTLVRKGSRRAARYFTPS